jgi:hypothetical protein
MRGSGSRAERPETLGGAVEAVASRSALVRVIVARGTFVRPYTSTSLRLGDGGASGGRSGGRRSKGDDTAGADELLVSPLDLDRAFRGVAPGVERPIVVLDAESPAGGTEAARQLLLRNAFAHELFALGNVPAVVALGLDGAASGQARFLDALAAGRGVVGAIEAARDAAGAGGGRAGLPPEVAAASIALWSNLPGYALPRAWRPGAGG